MKKAFPIYLYALVLFLLLPCGAGAQTVKRLPQRAAVDSLLNPSLHRGADKIFLFEKKTVNMGTLHESDTVRVVEFVFSNVSDTVVTITDVTTHCGCTAAEFDKKPIAAGEKSKIVVRYNPKGREGTVDTGAFVYTDITGRRPVAKLTLRGIVVDDDEWSHLPYAVGDLKFKRKQVVFKNGRIAARIPCANVGAKPMTLTSSFVPVYATFSTEPKVLQPGDEGDIVISINPDSLQKYAPATNSFSIIIEGVEGGISLRTIRAIIE